MARKKKDSNGGASIDSVIDQSFLEIEKHAAVIDNALKTRYEMFLAEPLPDYLLFLLDELEKKGGWT
ncbi:MAG: hypothetical protein ACK53I_04500 [Phenylobacterium sp.]